MWSLLPSKNESENYISIKEIAETIQKLKMMKPAGHDMFVASQVKYLMKVFLEIF